jgi:hypothetical protein
MVWRTHLVMYFGTDSVSASEIAKRLEVLGFETTFGSADFVFEWGLKEPSKEEVLALGDKVVQSLKGSGAVFNLDTHD